MILNPNGLLLCLYENNKTPIKKFEYRHPREMMLLHNINNNILI